MGTELVKYMLKLAFPEFMEGAGEMDDTRKIIEERIRELAERPGATAEALLTLSRAYSELARNDWLAKMPTNPLLINGPSGE